MDNLNHLIELSQVINNTSYRLGRFAGMLITIAIFVIPIYLLLKAKKKTKTKTKTEDNSIDLFEQNINETYKPLTREEIEQINRLTLNNYRNYSQAYERKYLMTVNEKAQFRKLQNWAHKNGYYIFTKVRLLDLITPRNDISNYKGALWKIQAKHVDFLICDKSISVKYIIEIDDNSHKQTDRIERDKFVVEVLRACGYKVLQTYNITDEQLNDIYKSINPQPMSEPIIPE